MNVLLVVPWDQQFGGVAAVVGNLARELRKSKDEVVFLYQGTQTRLRPRNTARGFPGYDLSLRSPFIRERPVKSIVAFSIFFLFTLYQLARVIRSHRIQIVNIHYPLEEFVYFGVLRWLLPIKLVVSVHGADLFEDGERLRRYPWPPRFPLFFSDAVVAPSQAFLKDCLVALPGIVSKALFIHNGIDIEELAQ